MQISLSSPELLTFFFSHNLKIQDGGGRHLGFSGYVNVVIRRVDSVVFVLCAKFGSNICYSHRDRHINASEIHDVTRINFRFWLLVTWSFPHGRDASSRNIWCRYLYPIRSYWHFSEIKDGGPRHLDFQVMWIWFRRVDSVVFVLCTKFGSNICYSHRDRHTYASDIHLMTSRKLTSGFDLWSRGHMRFPFYWWSNEMGLRFSKFWGISSRYGSPHKLA